MLFAAVNLARWLDVDPEIALRECNQRFRARFAYIENSARASGRRVEELSFEEMDALWEQAKRASREVDESGDKRGDE